MPAEIDTQPYYIEDFSGGITDFYLDAKPNRYRIANNLLIDRFQPLGRPISRYGSVIWDTTNFLIPLGHVRIGNLFLFRSGTIVDSITGDFTKILLVQSRNEIFFVGNGTNVGSGLWNTILSIGTTPVPVLISVASPAVFTTSLPHGLVDGQAIWFATSGTLPVPLRSDQAYYIINSTSTTFEVTQVQDTVTNPPNIVNTTAAGSGTHTFSRIPQNIVYIGVGASTNIVTTFAAWNDFIFTAGYIPGASIPDIQNGDFPNPQRLYIDTQLNTIVTQSSGLPMLDFPNTPAPNVDYGTQFTGTERYLYSAHLLLDYSVGSKTFEDLGTPFKEHINSDGTIVPFAALEVQSIDPLHSTTSANIHSSGPFSGQYRLQVHWVSHGLSLNDCVIFTAASGPLPTGVSLNTAYFVNFVISGDDFYVSSQLVNGAAGDYVFIPFTASPITVTIAQRHPIGIKTYPFPLFDPVADITRQEAGTYNPNVKIVISRTISGGTTYYNVATLVPGQNYFDVTNDTDLQNNQLLYTEDGTVPFTEAPPARYIHIVNDIGYYGYYDELTKDANQNPTTIRQNCSIVQSIPGIPGSVNFTFNFTFPEEVRGISSYQGNPIVLLDNSVFRVDGNFDELGRGGMFPQKISNEASCISHNSIVQTHEGIYWAGKNGIFFSDGYRVFRVSTGWPNTYVQLVQTDQQKRRIQGRLDAINRRIYWTVQEADSYAGDNNKIYVLDLNYGISEDMPFTSLSGNIQNGVDQFSSTSLEFNDNIWYRADRRGYIFTHSASSMADPQINTMTNPSTWSLTPIIFNLITAAFNFGMSFKRYWVTRLVVQCRNITNLSLQVLSINDDSRETAPLKPIKFRGNVVWGNPDIIWGDPFQIWNQTGFIEALRRFPANNLRCSFKQLQFTNAFIAIANSDVTGLATIDHSAKTATLSTGAWPVYATNFVIAFKNDNYVTQYAINARNSDTVITYTDPGNTSPANGTSEWVVRGINLNEVFALQSYTVHYAPLGKTQNPYRTSDSGENADAPQ